MPAAPLKSGREHQFASPAYEFAGDHRAPFGRRSALQHRVRAEPVHISEQQGHGTVEEGRRLWPGPPRNRADAAGMLR